MSGFKVFLDRNFDNTSNSLSLTIPRIDVTQVSPSAFTPLPRGKLVLNTDNTVYYSDGLVWIPLASGSITTSAIWEHVVAGNYIRINATNPDYDGAEALVFGQQDFDPATGSRFMFDQPAGAFRAGRTTGTQWDAASRGSNSTAFGFDNTASGSRSSVLGGFMNTASNTDTFLGGGNSNTAAGVTSTIGGGAGNSTNSQLNFIGGGNDNTTSGLASVICGGGNNLTNNDYSAVCGGETNIADELCFVGGGLVNEANNIASVICGGEQNTSNGDHSVIGGGENNNITGQYGVIAGGNSNVADDTASVGGGENNNATAFASTISGGIDNGASGLDSTVGGGSQNTAGSSGSTIAGGTSNTCGGTGGSTIGGGNSNTSSGANSTVPGGDSNSATGDDSFCCGSNASDGGNDGCFVASDSTAVSSSAANEFTLMYQNGGRVFTNAAQSTGVTIAAGGSAWAAVCDRNKKRNITEVDYGEILNKVDKLKIYNFVYKDTPDDECINYGPMAQEWHTQFPSSKDNLSIDTLDLDGVSFAAIKRLSGIAKSQQLQIENLQRQIDELKLIVNQQT